jgi:predicted metal-dependent phosphoesterase TrpH
MSGLRIAAGCLLAVAFVAGALSNTPSQAPNMILGSYLVLSADFHVHSFPLSWSALSPWDTVIEAQRHGLDVIAMTPHNHTWVAKAGRWYSRVAGGPIVIAGEEIVSARYHLLAIGIQRTIGWNQTAASAIDEIHRQGGVAIAAHPAMRYWPAYDAQARGKLDGAEVVHPVAWGSEEYAAQLRQFYESAHLTAFGDSDYHGLGPIGVCRTYVFTREPTEQGVLDAIRAGRTVVYDRGRAYGDPELIRLAAEDGRLPRLDPAALSTGFPVMLSRIAGIAGLLLAFFSLGGAHEPT